MVVLDPLIRFFNGEENSSTETTRFMELLEELVGLGTTIIFSHHTSKVSSGDISKNSARGSSAIMDAVRWSFSMSKLDESDSCNYLFEDSKETLHADDNENYIIGKIVKSNGFNPGKKVFTFFRTPTGPLKLLQDILTKK